MLSTKSGNFCHCFCCYCLCSALVIDDTGVVSTSVAAFVSVAVAGGTLVTADVAAVIVVGYCCS